jgi:hypothetical protein
MRLSRRAWLGGAAASLASCAAHAQNAPPPLPQPSPESLTPSAPTAIKVHARPLASFAVRDRSQTTFGRLRFRSGLILTSPWRGFGGMSAWRLDKDGERFVALSDKGAWFTGRLVYRGREMIGLEDVETAPILVPDGRAVATRKWFDTESLARDGGTLYVGIERANQILKFDFAADGVRAHGMPLALPSALRRLPYNKGLEALVAVREGLPRAGALIAISERGLDGSGNIVGALIGGPDPGLFAVHRTDNFDISDAAALPSGDVLILERKFSWLGGIGVRIRQLALAQIAPGALLDGPTVFSADLGQEIDNLEGLDVHVTPDGETVLTMISDDNFSLLQRTLLLQFTWMEP